MDQPSYRTSILVDATPADVYAAINDVRGWWSLDVDGPTDVLGAEFDFHGGNGQVFHRSRIRVAELVPGERVVWHVVENHLSFIDDQREWQDTDIVFELAATDAGTEIRFTHRGLVSAYECFDVCSNAWTFFLRDSLRGRIETGRGQPMLLDQTRPVAATV